VATEVETPPVQVPEIPLTEEQLAEGWIALFDGQTLFGWQAASQADWRVEDGTIVVSSGEPGLLHTSSQFSDYQLRLDFRSEAGANSGVFLHTPPVPEDPAKDCYELNIADSDNPYPTGSLVGRAKAEGDFDSLDWQSYEVTVMGDSVTVKLDGSKSCSTRTPSRSSGGISVCNFGRVRWLFGTST
jgi:hypothetical protein